MEGLFEHSLHDDAAPLYRNDEFRMYCFKVLPCSKRFCHDWTTCPFAHPSEKAKRRDPRACSYTGVACPEMKRSMQCPRGEACNFAHNVFEYWLHPSRYRTQLCNDGLGCRRKICFFAHTLEELRVSSVKVLPPDLARYGPDLARFSFDGPDLAAKEGAAVPLPSAKNPFTSDSSDDDVARYKRDNGAGGGGSTLPGGKQRLAGGTPPPPPLLSSMAPEAGNLVSPPPFGRSSLDYSQMQPQHSLSAHVAQQRRKAISMDLPARPIAPAFTAGGGGGGKQSPMLMGLPHQQHVHHPLAAAAAAGRLTPRQAARAQQAEEVAALQAQIMQQERAVAAAAAQQQLGGGVAAAAPSQSLLVGNLAETLTQLQVSGALNDPAVAAELVGTMLQLLTSSSSSPPAAEHTLAQQQQQQQQVLQQQLLLAALELQQQQEQQQRRLLHQSQVPQASELYCSTYSPPPRLYGGAGGGGGQRLFASPSTPPQEHYFEPRMHRTSDAQLVLDMAYQTPSAAAMTSPPHLRQQQQQQQQQHYQLQQQQQQRRTSAMVGAGRSGPAFARRTMPTAMPIGASALEMFNLSPTTAKEGAPLAGVPELFPAPASRPAAASPPRFDVPDLSELQQTLRLLQAHPGSGDVGGGSGGDSPTGGFGGLLWTPAPAGAATAPQLSPTQARRGGGDGSGELHLPTSSRVVSRANSADSVGGSPSLQSPDGGAGAPHSFFSSPSGRSSVSGGDGGCDASPLKNGDGEVDTAALKQLLTNVGLA